MTDESLRLLAAKVWQLEVRQYELSSYHKVVSWIGGPLFRDPEAVELFLGTSRAYLEIIQLISWGHWGCLGWGSPVGRAPVHPMIR